MGRSSSSRQAAKFRCNYLVTRRYERPKRLSNGAKISANGSFPDRAGQGRRELCVALRWNDLPAEVLATLRKGAVIPAHPLALDSARKFDERRQRALTRYYVDAGSGGLAVGVHTTQFAIREVGLYEPVLSLAMKTCLLYTSPSPRDRTRSRMPSSA